MSEQTTDNECLNMTLSEQSPGYYIFPSRTAYYGPLSNGLPHGHGISKWPSGEMRYVGRFENGIYNGHGVYTGVCGFRYDGDFVDGLEHGSGFATWPDHGTSYMGEWKGGKRHGHGTYTWPDGKIYIGEWKEDRKHGNGTLTWLDGSVFQGEWRANVCSGLGKFTKTDGTIFHDGRWKGGRPVRNRFLSFRFKETCLVCLERFAHGDALVATECKRCFHKHCLDHWSQDKDGQPILNQFLSFRLEDTCLICLEHFAHGDAIVATECKHCFHEHCLDRWCQDKDGTTVPCPKCRKEVLQSLM